MRRVSIIVPVYYGEEYISGIIRQAEACRKYMSDEDNIEIIFVNDAPEVPILHSWESADVHLSIINTDKNEGIQGARVKGLKRCHGEYVLFLDQDDRIEPEYFFSQFTALGENDAVICKAIYAGKECYSDEEAFKKIISKEFVLKEWNQIISPGQVLLRRDSIPDIWMENILKYNGADDWFLWLCMMAEGRRFSLNESVLYEHVSHGSNTSDNIVAMAQSEHELMRIVQKSKIFSETDLQLLMEGFFLRNLIRVQEMSALKQKMNILDKWMKLRENNIKYSDYLCALDIKSVIIYGCGMLGRHLFCELKCAMCVKCFVDRNAGEMQEEIPVYTLEESWPEADCIIITLVDGIEKAENDIKAKAHKKILVLKDWIMKTEYLY